MTNEEILKKALLKVWKAGHFVHEAGTYTDQPDGSNSWASFYAANPEEAIYKLKQQYGVYGIIFSHDFAKAFFKDRRRTGVIYTVNDKLSNEYYIENWLYHLQQMVLEKEPLKYLEKFL